MNNYLIIFLALVFSGFFSGMEIAFVSANKLRIELDMKQGVIGSGIIKVFVANPGAYIATMLVGNNIALVIYGIVMALLLEPSIRQFIDSDGVVLAVQTILSTLLILFVAEFLPKTLFRLVPNLSLRIFAIPVYFFYIILYPITRLTIGMSNLIMRVVLRVPRERQGEDSVFTKHDLDYLVSEANMEIGEEQEQEHEIKIFQNALDFSKVRLRDCMVPRTEIVALEETATIADLRQRFIESGLSKILIYRESTDDIIGYVNSKELFRNPGDLQSIINRIPIVPETMPAIKLLQSFIEEHKSISVVVDEFGGTSGIVTMEDIIEEIVGEIEDEHDTSVLREEQVSDNEFIFSARHEIDYLNEKYRLEIPVSDEYETLAGFILLHLESIPKINERITIDPFMFRILDMGETRIELVQLSLESNP